MRGESTLAANTCDQCGLPFGRGGTTRSKNGIVLHFCCYGCSFTYSVIGEKGEAGLAGLFLARLGFAAFLSVNIMLLSWVIYDQQWITFGIEPEVLPYLEKLLFVLATPVMLVVGFPFFRNAVLDLRKLRFSMDSLIALGSFAAYGFSTYQVFSGGMHVYFDTGTMVIVLVTTGRYLESNAKIRSATAIKQLLALQPDVARVVHGEKEVLIPTGEVAVGRMLKVLPGERIPLDGTVAEGLTSVNESILSGESLPSTKRVGEHVFAATTNIEGTILVRVTASVKDTVHLKLVRLMEEAQRSRAPIQQSVDRISGVFIPLVTTVGLLTFGGWTLVAGVDVALLHALSVLVVACPCALGIGTPLAATIALGRAAEHGVLVRSPAVLERLAETRVVAFDKTGTLTKGELSPSNLYTERDEREFLSYLASIEKSSEHSLSKGVLSLAEERDVPILQVRNVVTVPGLGIKGELRANGGWKTVLVGNRVMLEQSEASFSEELLRMEAQLVADQEGIGTVIYVGWDGAVHGFMGMRDSIRQTARDVVRRLHEQGISTVLLSGDSLEATRSVARSVAIEQAFGKLLPQQKLEFIQFLRPRGTTMMVGDGINDAPSLAAADIGVTLGSATDIAKESADVTILGDHLEKIPKLLRYAAKTLSTIRWNLFWAFAYNSVGVALAVAGLLEPILAALAMLGSSLFIIVNSRRLSKASIE